MLIRFAKSRARKRKRKRKRKPEIKVERSRSLNAKIIYLHKFDLSFCQNHARGLHAQGIETKIKFLKMENLTSVFAAVATVNDIFAINRHK